MQRGVYRGGEGMQHSLHTPSPSCCVPCLHALLPLPSPLLCLHPCANRVWGKQSQRCQAAAECKTPARKQGALQMRGDAIRSRAGGGGVWHATERGGTQLRRGGTQPGGGGMRLERGHIGGTQPGGEGHRGDVNGRVVQTGGKLAPPFWLVPPSLVASSGRCQGPNLGGRPTFAFSINLQKILL